MYTQYNFQTKKALKEAVASGKHVAIFQPNDMSGNSEVKNGTFAVEGPHYPQPHKWYAQVVLQDGKVIKVT